MSPAQLLHRASNRPSACRITGAIAAVFVAISLGLVAGAQAADSAWTVGQIGEPEFTAMAINESGVVAGYVGVYPNYRAAVWNGGTTTFLATPENTTRSIATGINKYGHVVGQVDLATEEFTGQEAVMWNASGQVTLLGFLPGGSFSSAQDINDTGKVVGVTSVSGQYQGFLWDGDGPIEALPMPSGMTSSFAVAINNLGQIVGSASAMYQPGSAVLWQNGVATTLTPLAQGATATASDINDSGQIVGNSATTAAPWLTRDPVLWEGGNVIDLGSLGGAFAIAQGINNNSQVVGLMMDTASLFHAFVWKDSVLMPLPPLAGDSEAAAFDINGHGQAVGWSRMPGAATRAVLWMGQKSAPEMVADLIILVKSYKLGTLGTSLTDKLVTVQRMLANGKSKQACENLDSFLSQVKAQKGKGLTVDQAKALTDGARAIKDVIGC